MKSTLFRIQGNGLAVGSVGLAATLLLLSAQTGQAAKRTAAYNGVPDFTKKETAAPSDGLDNALGTTGARGWVYQGAKNPEGATQIYVTAVKEGSPAHGKLQQGDVILGAAAGNEAKPFLHHARKELAAALLEGGESQTEGGNDRQGAREGHRLPEGSHPPDREYSLSPDSEMETTNLLRPPRVRVTEGQEDTKNE